MVSSGFFRSLGRPRVGIAVLTMVAAGFVLPAGSALGAEEQPSQPPTTGEKAPGTEALPEDSAGLLERGIALQEREDHAGALELFRRALALDERDLGKDHADVAVSLAYMGGALRALGDSAGALEHYRRALAIGEQALDKDHPDVATYLNNIGSAL